ncbi:sigma-E factor negative regulatory protein [Arsukibacterium sp.]|uniref:sigma-E factor negative regulatory protein n=1 Tax=Arsukibacterium sp. TaxID=1977258 RepID=UPI002FD9A7B9
MVTEKQAWLSAASDNEPLSADELSLLLNSPELQHKLERYQLASAVLRQEAHSVLPADFSERLQLQLADEPVYHLAPAAAKPSASWLQRLGQAANATWFKPAANGAIAASVALLAVLGVQQYQQPFGQELLSPSPVLQTRPVAGFATPVSLSQTTVSTRFEEQEQQAMLEQQQRLQAMLQAHRQQLRVMSQTAEVKPDVDPEANEQ